MTCGSTNMIQVYVSSAYDSLENQAVQTPVAPVEKRCGVQKQGSEFMIYQSQEKKTNTTSAST